MSDMRTELDRALRRESAADMRVAGESFCGDCPDREACSTGYPCDFVRRVDAEAATRRIAELAAANEAAMTAHKAAQSYADATAAAWVATQAALVAALIEHQGDKS